jgi:hypothetical protein
MYAVSREHSQDKEVRDHYGQVEAVELINSAEWIPSGIHKARPVIDPPALSRYQQNEISAEQAVRSSST